MSKSFFEELNWRGLVNQSTPNISKAFESGATIYQGFDPTGSEMHIGHFLGLATLKRALQYGQKIIILIGGGTGMIGDPSGKDKERPVLIKDEIERNKEIMKNGFKPFFSFDDDNVKMVDNSSWLSDLPLVSFLRDAGKYITVNSMLDKDSVSVRMERDSGISYAEFSYQLLQAYDFSYLYEKYGCNVQLGGSDQWGNIIQGVELIRKKIGKEAFGLSIPLITNPKTGKKFGKTESGESIWLSAEKTHPFDFYQFFLNMEDEMAEKLIYYFSFKSKNEIEEILHSWQSDKSSRLVQYELAYEITSFIHGKDFAENVKAISKQLFENKEPIELTEENLLSMKDVLPSTTVQSHDDYKIEDIVFELKLVSSKSEARRLIQQNGVKFWNIGKYRIFRKGKKEYGIVFVC